MKAEILIVEDEVEIADLISLYLGSEGFSTLHAASAEEALERLSGRSFDLVILDINLPGMDGFEFLQKIRKSHGIPVVIVSARQDDADMILGLGIGADDYVTKPFSPKVLVARVRANLRRWQNQDDERTDRPLLRFSGYTLDREAYRLKRGNERIALSPREFEVLTYLVDNAGNPRTPDEIYRAVWGNSYGDLTTVAVHIQRLRKKLEKDPSTPGIIETVHGLGYMVKREILS